VLKRDQVLTFNCGRVQKSRLLGRMRGAVTSPRLEPFELVAFEDPDFEVKE
jgi:hypothetical protein